MKFDNEKQDIDQNFVTPAIERTEMALRLWFDNEPGMLVRYSNVREILHESFMMVAEYGYLRGYGSAQDIAIEQVRKFTDDLKGIVDEG